MFCRVGGRPVLPRMDRVAQRRQMMSRCQRIMVSGGDQKPQSLAASFRYHGHQGREQGAVRPGQSRAARLMALQDRELVAQEQDLAGLPRFVTPGQPQPRDHPRDHAGRRTAGT